MVLSKMISLQRNCLNCRSMISNLTSELMALGNSSMANNSVNMTTLKNIGAAEQYFKMGVLREAEDIKDGIGKMSF